MIEPQPVRRLLVLVADDDEDILQLLSFRLERAGYEIVLARSGDEALRLALELLPAVAILDGMMPGLDPGTRRSLFERIHARVEAAPGRSVRKTYLATLTVGLRP